MNEFEKLGMEYGKLLSQQQFIPEDLDYGVLKNHIPFLDRLAQVNNSAVTVFDLCKKEHVYASYNFSELFGYDLGEIEKQGNQYFDSRVHPDDLLKLMKTGVSIVKFYYSQPKEKRRDYKFVNEYRVLGNDGYVRVIEQHQLLELDIHGNVWLSLGVIDISPDQSDFEGIRSQVYNYKTGKVYPVPMSDDPPAVNLSKRETEVLQLVKEGMPSKAISEKLFISIHTVNTHRQRILGKLGVKNSAEAIAYGSRLGLVS